MKEDIKLTPSLLVMCDEDEYNSDLLPGHEHLNPKLTIVGINQSLPVIREQVNLPSNIGEGDLLVRDPYSLNSYIKVEDDTAEKLCRKKYHHIIRLAELLGAKRSRIKQVKGVYRKRDLNFDASLKLPKGSGNVKVEDSEVLELFGLTEIKSVCNGVEHITEESYNDAREFAKEHCLIDIPEAISLLEGRNPKQINPKKNLTITFEGQSELNKLFDIAATCTALKMFKFQAHYRKTFERREKYTLVIEFEFP